MLHMYLVTGALHSCCPLSASLLYISAIMPGRTRRQTATKSKDNEQVTDNNDQQKF